MGNEGVAARRGVARRTSGGRGRRGSDARGVDGGGGDDDALLYGTPVIVCARERERERWREKAYGRAGPCARERETE